MKRKLKIPPKFSSEAAERTFWASYDSTQYADWSAAKRVRLAKLKLSTKTISIRLPKYLLDSIRQIANSRDVPYQSLIKLWLQEHATERR